MNTPKASVIVLVWNGIEYVGDCLDAVLAQDHADFEVIVVDNNSTDGSADSVAERYRRVRLIRNKYNLGFSGGNNVGLQVAQGDFVVLLNQDTVVYPGWLEAIADGFADPTVGIVGCKILYPDERTIQHAGCIVQPDTALTHHVGWKEIDEGQYDALGKRDYVTGAAMGIHRRVLERLGGLDEGFFPAFYEDLDYCERARRAGFQIAYQPAAVLLHHESTSMPRRSYRHVAAFHRNRVRFVLRHWDTNAITQGFRTAEERATDDTQWLDDAIARARAHWDNLVALPFVSAQRERDSTLGNPLSSPEVLHIAEVLQSLRLQARERGRYLTAAASQDTSVGIAEQDFLSFATPACSQKPKPSVDLAHSRDLQELDASHNLQEHHFTSAVPVVGPLIARFREEWLSMAARLYVRSIMQQQSAVNERTVRLFRETARLFDGLLMQQQVGAADDASLAAALRSFAARLERLEQAVKETCADSRSVSDGRDDE
jgi:GT2 family glycosyltransferase